MLALAEDFLQNSADLQDVVNSMANSKIFMKKFNAYRPYLNITGNFMSNV